MLWLGWVLAAPAMADDDDRDGWDSEEDCDDDDPSVYPGAPEGCDGVDSDCDGSVPSDEQDVDQDGLAACEGDCDDDDADIHPDALEQCNGVDDDCDRVVDEDCPTTPIDTGGTGNTGSEGNPGGSGGTTSGTTGGTTGGTTSDPAPDTIDSGIGVIDPKDEFPDDEPLQAAGTSCACGTGSTGSPGPAGLSLGAIALLFGIALPARRRR